ncbi:methyltransferase domain-containing protein [Sediminibacillus halophilus]|uniref:Methyltransferase domain-containing protein n=1 Tax=Sediminibacillus halophilus TaxID=482461 RepID=A0A1G9P1W5_9BACI|nr:methyltransferase domain-containing protein [Sediminibacillus halophilus]SDL92866.1 Methyltransferase domain-containing protein [Sediminibacillus halophilus]
MKLTEELLEKNRAGWNTVAHHFNGQDALPGYGPYAQTEDELKLFGEIKDKKVLEIGFGSGHSLRYMAEKGAAELWGVDFSEEQKEIAEITLQDHPAHLFCAPMETEIGLPKAYFDYVYSIYAVGWTTDLSATFQLIYSYLKRGGSFIFSWDHPFYPYIKSENGLLYLDASYQEESMLEFDNFKGGNKPMAFQRRKMSTYLNALICAGFSIERVIESDVPVDLNDVKAEQSDSYYSLYKAQRFPASMIIKAVKK